MAENNFYKEDADDSNSDFRASGDIDGEKGKYGQIRSGLTAESETATKEWNVKCDDCPRTEPIRMWRWCDNCERMLCETCSVEGHCGHTIEPYATAVRISDVKHRKVLEEIRRKVETLGEGAHASGEICKEIISTLSAVKNEIRVKVDESRDVEDTLNEYLMSISNFKNQPLNAQTWAERQQYMAGLEELSKTAALKRKKMDEYLKRMDAVVDDMGVKLNQIFRDDN